MSRARKGSGSNACRGPHCLVKAIPAVPFTIAAMTERYRIPPPRPFALPLGDADEIERRARGSGR